VKKKRRRGNTKNAHDEKEQISLFLFTGHPFLSPSVLLPLFFGGRPPSPLTRPAYSATTAGGAGVSSAQSN
jgi:hypothetical protein